MINKEKYKKRNIEIKGNVSESIVGDNNSVTINKNSKNKIWTIVVGVFTIIGVVAGIFFEAKQIQKNKEETINVLKQNAIKTFEKKEFDLAFNLFYELKKELPNDSTGYYLFLNIAKELLKHVEYDNHICDLLKKANQLHNTPEINNLLDNCK